jgi:NTP pyrophosphatase (non-canonical NTP hydrolase)
MISPELHEFISKQHVSLLKRFDGDKNNLTFPFMVKISEEVGELSEEILRTNGFQRTEKLAQIDPSAVEKELADVILATLILAKHLNVDIDGALSKKINYISERAL